MVEYILDAVKARAGQNITITARITDGNGMPITEGIRFNLSDDYNMLVSVAGEYNADEDIWYFDIPADETAGREGQYYYCISLEEYSLCFRKPFYLVV